MRTIHIFFEAIWRQEVAPLDPGALVSCWRTSTALVHPTIRAGPEIEAPKIDDKFTRRTGVWVYTGPIEKVAFAALLLDNKSWH